MSESQKPHIAILGAGPTGLEAGLAAAEAGFSFTVFEAAESVAGHMRDWGHIRLFTGWNLALSPRMRKALAAAGVELPAGAAPCPTGNELVERVFEPLSSLPSIRPRLELGTRVVALSREGLLKHDEIGTGRRGEHPFRLLLRARSGGERIAHADVVLDCTGSYAVPNALGSGGIPAPGEEACSGSIARRVPDLSLDAARWSGRRILLVGAGHSAQTAARDLAELAHARPTPGTRIIWSTRGRPTWSSGEDDPLPARAALVRAAGKLAAGSSPFFENRFATVVDRIAPHGKALRVSLRGASGAETVDVDRILALTGASGDHQIYRQLQVQECYATAGPLRLAAQLLGESDCMQQEVSGIEALAHPEPGFFILGAKSYGSKPSFLMRIGWEQVGVVMAQLSTRHAPSSRSSASEARS